jgi:hypothetical protein
MLREQDLDIRIEIAAPDDVERKERGFKSTSVRRYPAHQERGNVAAEAVYCTEFNPW